MPVKYQQNASIIQSKIDDEVVMLDMSSGFYFGLNSVASDIWGHLQEPITMEALVEKLMADYAVDWETCMADTKELLKQMLEKKIIREEP